MEKEMPELRGHRLEVSMAVLAMPLRAISVNFWKVSIAWIITRWFFGEQSAGVIVIDATQCEAPPYGAALPAPGLEMGWCCADESSTSSSWKRANWLP